MKTWNKYPFGEEKQSNSSRLSKRNNTSVIVQVNSKIRIFALKRICPYGLLSPFKDTYLGQWNKTRFIALESKRSKE
jgi:hypothetical protein